MEKLKLSELVAKIESKHVLLPDFQRGFVWKDIEDQRALAASVLTQLPIGTILLLESCTPSEYKCRVVGTSQSVDANSVLNRVHFLLDGQQRITVLMNLFSNKIYQFAQNRMSNIIDNSLKRRFFLQLPSGNVADSDEDDIFGALSLTFPKSAVDGKPEFSTEQIRRLLVVESLPRNQKEPFHPYASDEIKDKLKDNYCVPKRRIPLYLLLEADSQLLLEQIIENIAKTIAQDIWLRVYRCRDDIAQIDLIASKCNWNEEVKNKVLDAVKSINNENADQNERQLPSILETKAQRWRCDMINYLKTCLNELMLDQIIVPESDRVRAIDIYENLNRGGVSLSVFDLLIARSALDDCTPLVERIKDKIDTPCIYKSVYRKNGDVERQYNQCCEDGKYNAAKNMLCTINEKKYIEAFINVLALVVECNGDNIDKLIEYVSTQDDSDHPFSRECIKREAILKLQSKEINAYCEKVCDAIGRALMFLQGICGVRKITEVNYSLMISVISFILYFEDDYTNENLADIIALLSAWYWSSIFSGTYDKDQNTVMINDLNHLLTNAIAVVKNVKVDITWLNDRIDSILKTKGFSDKDFLVGNTETDEMPKGVLRATICQYFLSKGYFDLKIGTECLLTVFCNQADSLEEHHVIPLGSTKTIGESTKELRNNRKHFLNYPLNFLYITKEANKEISSKSLADYSQTLEHYQSLSLVGFQDTAIESNSTDEAKKKILLKRHDALIAEITSEVRRLLNVFRKDQ